MNKKRYAFVLGREYKLSLAELGSIFGFENLLEFNETVAIFEIQGQIVPQTLLSIGGTTRIIQILGESSAETFPTDVITYIRKNHQENKIRFALGTFGHSLPLSGIALRIKKTLQKNFTVRALNSRNENIHSAVFKKEKLAKSQTEFSIIQSPSDESKSFFGVTIACQDIDNYNRRDTGKNRDMVVGMMPPKLVQMMINIARGPQGDFAKMSLYDPFCGLGTTLIEAANMGILNIFGSDISKEMVTNSEESLKNFIKDELVWQERIRNAGGAPSKDFRSIQKNIFPLDARQIEEAFKNYDIPKDTLIISEGFLGKIMRKHEITEDKVLSERRTITRLYEDFFSSLKTADFRGTIVMSFPFWKVFDRYIYLESIPEILTKNNFKIESLIPREHNLNTKNGSLLYRRESQQVGREILKITRK